jgi:hypothetical protein
MALGFRFSVLGLEGFRAVGKSVGLATARGAYVLNPKPWLTGEFKKGVRRFPGARGLG